MNSSEKTSDQVGIKNFRLKDDEGNLDVGAALARACVENDRKNYRAQVQKQLKQ